MSNMALTIGNKNYSSWSLRGYLAVEQTGAAYEENLIPLYEAGSAALLRQHSASGLVPALRHGDVQMWDSLAIAEYLAETFPDAGLWPSEPSIWHDCRERFGKTAGKDFLFGNFCAADVMYAPVVFRFATYGVDVDEVEKRYMDAMRARPEMQRWVAAAHEEPWTMDWDVV